MNGRLLRDGGLASAPSLAAQWSAVADCLRDEFGDAAYENWLRLLRADSLSDGRLLLTCPTRYIRDWILSHYGPRLSELWAEVTGNPADVEIEVAGGGVPPRLAPARLSGLFSPGEGHLGTEDQNGFDAHSAPLVRREAGAPLTSHHQPMAAGGGEEISAPLDNRFTFENFIVGKSNELAHAAARRVAEAAAVPFNPLFLYGGVGLGKTHLMHAIAWEIRRRTPQRRVIYLSAEKFMYQFIRALRYKDTMAFKQQFRSIDVLMIDDVQFISGKDSTQEEFFHTFNALIDHNRQVIISADRSPSDLDGIEERIRSRLGWGLVADIHPTDYELRLGILQSKAEMIARQHGAAEIGPRILEFLAHRIISNVRELEGALNRVVAFATLVGRPITLEMTQEVLQDLLRANDRRVTIEEIQRKVAQFYHLRMDEMTNSRRARSVARPRQVAMYLAKQLTSRSLPDIGRRFGGRDHTTVIHAVRKIEELKAEDPRLAEEVELLRRMLEC